MTRIDILVSDLCDEIDMWKAEAQRWEDRYNEEKAERLKFMKATEETAKATLGQVLTLALRSTQTPDGLLIKQNNGN